MYSAAARTPASDSNGSVPSSHRSGDSSGDGLSLSGWNSDRISGRPQSIADVRAEPLVGRAADARRRRGRRGRCGGAAWRGRRRRRRARRRRARRRRSPARSGTVPIALDAAVTATHLVRSLKHRLDGARRAAPASPRSRLGEAHASRPPARPRSPTGARWSRGPGACRRSRRPARSARTTVAAKRIVSAVNDGPKTTPSGSPPSSVAHAARVDSTSSSVSCACLNTPPWLACAAGAHPVRHRLDRAVDDLDCRRARRDAPSRRAARGSDRGS